MQRRRLLLPRLLRREGGRRCPRLVPADPLELSLHVRREGLPARENSQFSLTGLAPRLRCKIAKGTENISCEARRHAAPSRTQPRARLVWHGRNSLLGLSSRTADTNTRSRRPQGRRAEETLTLTPPHEALQQRFVFFRGLSASFRRLWERINVSFPTSNSSSTRGFSRNQLGNTDPLCTRHQVKHLHGKRRLPPGGGVPRGAEFDSLREIVLLTPPSAGHLSGTARTRRAGTCSAFRSGCPSPFQQKPRLLAVPGEPKPLQRALPWEGAQQPVAGPRRSAANTGDT